MKHSKKLYEDESRGSTIFSENPIHKHWNVPRRY